jgi:DNA-binding MarR family transcriptional regulator
MSAAATLADQIRVLMRAFTIDEARGPAAEGLLRHNAADFQTIAFVGAHPGTSSAALARFLGVAATTAQSVIDRLVKADVLVRKAGAHDKRTVALHLSEHGEAVRAAIARQDEANCAFMLEALSPEDQNRFLGLMAAIVARVSDRAG